MDYEEEVTAIGLILLLLFGLIIVCIGAWYNTIKDIRSSRIHLWNTNRLPNWYNIFLYYYTD